MTSLNSPEFRHLGLRRSELWRVQLRIEATTWLNLAYTIGVADGLGVVHQSVSAVLAGVVCVRDGESPIVRRGMGGSRIDGDGQLWPEEAVRSARRSLSGTADGRA